MVAVVETIDHSAEKQGENPGDRSDEVKSRGERTEVAGLFQATAPVAHARDDARIKAYL